MKHRFLFYRDIRLNQYFVEGSPNISGYSDLVELVEYIKKALFRGDLNCIKPHEAEFIFPLEPKVIFYGGIPLTLYPLSKEEIAKAMRVFVSKN